MVSSFIIVDAKHSFASTMVKEKQKCIYTNSSGKIVFNKVCDVRFGVAVTMPCSYLPWGSVFGIDFTDKSKLRIVYMCDNTILINGVIGERCDLGSDFTQNFCLNSGEIIRFNYEGE